MARFLTTKQRGTIRSIDGWLTDREMDTLFTLAKNCTGKGVIVEIGSWKGKSTVCLGYGSQAGKKVHIIAIDPHTGTDGFTKRKQVSTYASFKKNIKDAQVEKYVSARVTTSEAVSKIWKKPVEVLWIDGSHQYNDVKNDIMFWTPFLINGGTIALHDTINMPGPKRAVRECIIRSPEFKNIRTGDSILYAEKTDHVSLKEQMQKYRMLIIHQVISNVWKIPTPVIVRSLGKRCISFLE